jgi:ABC-type transport system involved in multi-copper enzyme maturation permease subunit
MNATAIELLRIDLKKMVNYRTFWVVCGLYFLTLAFVTASGMEILKWLASKGAEFGAQININRIPLYHFPDVWQNLLYISGFFKIVIGVMVVISITNEFTYRTIRQNVIDGLSRWEFLYSKILTNLLLSLMSVAMMFIIAMVTGLIYSPELVINDILTDIEFFPAYFLEVFSFLSYALMLGMLVQRSGLTIILLMLSAMIEAIIKVNLPDGWEPGFSFFPMQSISNLIAIPFPRYAFQQIQDYVSIQSVLISVGWTVLFNYFSYLKLKKSDI